MQPYANPNTPEQAVLVLRELILEMEGATRDLERMRAEYEARPEVREKFPSYATNFFPSRIGEFRRQTARLERGLANPQYRAGGEFANALRWYQSLAYAFDTNLSWSAVEGPLLDRLARMDRLTNRIIELQEGPGAIAR